jgi:hypothetical protein
MSEEDLFDFLVTPCPMKKGEPCEGCYLEELCMLWADSDY